MGAVLKSSLELNSHQSRDLNRLTYEGRDWIMTEFAGWLDSSTHLTYGVEDGGVLKAIENVAIVDNGTTAWLQALRVHPDLRQQGVARRLQLHMVETTLARFPAVRQLRYTTGTWNTASLRLAAACGLSPTFEWGIALCKDAPAPAAAAEPSTCLDGDEVTFSPMPFTQHRDAFLAEYARVCKNDPPRDRAASAAEIEALVSLPCGVAAQPTVWVLDWKCVSRADGAFDALIANHNLKCRTVSFADKAGGVAYGKTRKDFQGHVRVSTVSSQYVAGEQNLGYAATLLLLAAELQQAIDDGADSAMFFYDTCFEEQLVGAGLTASKRCVLLERTLDHKSPKV